MAKVRQDAWSHEDDLLLAETVLRHVREGSTQLNAFEEVGDILNRTSAACGFRWNAEVRKKYDDAMELAKRQRKEKKRAMEKNASKTAHPILSLPQNYETNQQTSSIIVDTPTMTIDSVIDFLKTLKKDHQSNRQSKITLDQFQQENERLKEKINELEKQLSTTENQLSTIQEDYQAFIQIMDRARKMTVLEDQENYKGPTFKMDKNGNLEQLPYGGNL